MIRFLFLAIAFPALAACASYEAKPNVANLKSRSIAVVIKDAGKIPVQLSGGPFTSDVRRTVDAKPLKIAEALLAGITQELQKRGYAVQQGIANATDDELRDGAHVGNVRIDRIGKRKEQIRALSSSLNADLILVVSPQPPIGNNFFVRGMTVHQVSTLAGVSTNVYAAFAINLADGKTGGELSWTYQTVVFPLDKTLDEPFIDVESNVLGLLSKESWLGLALSIVPGGINGIGL